MTVTESYNNFREQLRVIYDVREADHITAWIFEKLAGLARWKLRDNTETMTAGAAARLQNALMALLKQMPVQYVLNEAWFYKRKFFVDQHVLIPRPETEELVEWLVRDLLSAGKSMPAVLDIGCGSGCIAVTIKKEMPGAEVTTIDVSREALQVAQKNAADLHAPVRFIHLDFLNEEEWKSLEKYDVIISNPPYIPFAEKNLLHPNVRDFEPSLALFVADHRPLIFYEKIALFARQHLLQGGNIYAEVHEDHSEGVKNIFEQAGYKAIPRKDLYGRERMMKCSRPA